MSLHLSISTLRIVGQLAISYKKKIFCQICEMKSHSYLFYLKPWWTLAFLLLFYYIFMI